LQLQDFGHADLGAVWHRLLHPAREAPAVHPRAVAAVVHDEKPALERIAAQEEMLARYLLVGVEREVTVRSSPPRPTLISFWVT
jgi:hypothetical protein